MPTPVPLFPLLTLQTLLGASGAPFPWPLAAFCTWALHQPELSEAPVRSVLCNRRGVHEFILLSTEIVTSSGVVTLWFRIERYPSSQGVSVLLSKTKPAVDTLKASTDLQVLREPCESRDSFMYSAHKSPREVLRFKHIAEMCRYFTGHSSEYSLLGANCRWICYALLECLREARECYGGDWFPSRNERPTVDVKVAQLAKTHYLKDKHPTCCGSQYLVNPSFGAITRATLGLASIAVSSSSQNSYNGGLQYAADQEMYGTSPSLPESAIPQHQPAPAASVGPQAPSTNRAASSSTIPPNVIQPLRVATQPNRLQNDVSPPPAGANATQHPQSPPIEQTSSAQLQQRNTTPPAQHTASQPTGGSPAPHCSGCQCADHSTQNMSNNPQSGSTPSHAPLLDSRRDDVSGLASQLSSMHIQSDTLIAGQWAGQDITIPREPSPSSGRPCTGSCCSPQGNTFAQPSTPTFAQAPPMPAASHSPPATRPMHPGRVHPGASQRSTTSMSAGSTHFSGTTSSTVHPPAHHGRYPSQAGRPGSQQSVHGPRRVSANTFNTHRLSQFSFTGALPTMTEVDPSYAHHTGASLGTDYPGTDCLECDPRASMHLQGRQHTHNHPPPEQLVDPLGAVPHNHHFSHVNGNPRQHHTHEMPAAVPAHQARRNPHIPPNQPRMNTGGSYPTQGNYTLDHGPPAPRNTMNGSNIHQQAFHDHAHVPPSPRYNSSMLGEPYHPAQYGLYGISEDAPQPEFENQWIANGMGVDLSEYGAQPMSNHIQQQPLSNFPQLASDYSTAQNSGMAFQQSYTPNGLPAGPYSQQEQPTRQWTQQVWGDQELAPPPRTESPSQLEYPSNPVYPMPQESPTLTRMPDPHAYPTF
ncbi:unnamed protein product [Rhizoctonia solani]|uniref:Uncharacterized protein n=1 Tax=Rhizoctonia solani TaxID=456999 RepID=A0A8H3E440_9AGAM|nr:unnamed protein product [Rhizoctonia solani]